MEGNYTGVEKNHVEQATGEVKTIFRGGNIWGNESVLALAPRTLGIPEGAIVRHTQQVTTFPAGGNALRAGTTYQDLHRALVGENIMLHTTVRGDNGMVEATGTVA